MALVASMAVLRLRAKGLYAAIPRAEALRLFDETLSRNWQAVRALARAVPVAGRSMGDRTDKGVLALVREHIRNGTLVAVQAAARGQPQALGEVAVRRGLGRAIEQQGGLEHAGCRYRLVANVELASLPDRDRYEVVGREVAQHILGELAAQPSNTAVRAELLRRARDGLTNDWRPPLGTPDGLILLRRVRVAAVTNASGEPAITPSQWRALASAGWIEIEFVDPQGLPVDVPFCLELPDATLVTTRSDADGLAARRGFVPGMCRLSLPTLDAARWRLATDEGRRA